MSTLWVVVANRGFAKIYEVKGHGREIKEIHHLDNPEGHVRGAIPFSDRPGRTFDRLGAGRHALQDKNIHEHEQLVFTHRIRDILEHGKQTKAFDELAIVAPPVFMGELNNELTHDLKKLITKEVGKDLPEHYHEKERIEHLRKYLDLWNDSDIPRVKR